MKNITDNLIDYFYKYVDGLPEYYKQAWEMREYPQKDGESLFEFAPIEDKKTKLIQI